MTPKAREAAHIERLDSLIAPLSKYDLPADDAPKIKGAIEALAANKPDKAAEFAKDVSDPIGRKLIAWYRLRQGQGEARDYLAFLDANPDWPSRDYLRQRMEEALFIEGGGTDLIATYFKDGKALSGSGLALLASVELAHGNKDKAKALASEAWRKYDLPASLEPGFLTRFGSLLDGGGPQVAPRPSARRRCALPGKPQGARRDRQARHSPALRRRAKEGAGPARRVPAVAWRQGEVEGRRPERARAPTGASSSTKCRRCVRPTSSMRQRS